MLESTLKTTVLVKRGVERWVILYHGMLLGDMCYICARATIFIKAHLLIPIADLHGRSPDAALFTKLTWFKYFKHHLKKKKSGLAT